MFNGKCAIFGKCQEGVGEYTVFPVHFYRWARVALNEERKVLRRLSEGDPGRVVAQTALDLHAKNGLPAGFGVLVDDDGEVKPICFRCGAGPSPKVLSWGREVWHHVRDEGSHYYNEAMWLVRCSVMRPARYKSEVSFLQPLQAKIYCAFIRMGGGELDGGGCSCTVSGHLCGRSSGLPWSAVTASETRGGCVYVCMYVIECVGVGVGVGVGVV